MLTEEKLKDMVSELDAQRARLLPYFENVQCHKDWKNPIKATVPEGDLQHYVDAIRFFTATDTTVEPSVPGYVEISSVGYRLGPAGDH